jgi:hypothetical protein
MHLNTIFMTLYLNIKLFFTLMAKYLIRNFIVNNENK